MAKRRKKASTARKTTRRKAGKARKTSARRSRRKASV